MKLFIASHSQEAARSLKRFLMQHGHEVTSRWIDQDAKFGHKTASYSDAERARIAAMDEEDVRAAVDGLVVIAEPEGRCVPGGKHVETGIALALNRPIYVVGQRENIFHWHPCVRVVQDVSALCNLLRQVENDP